MKNSVFLIKDIHCQLYSVFLIKDIHWQLCPKTFYKSTSCAGDLSSVDSVPSLCFQCSPFPAGYKEMSSILADQ